MATFPAFKTVYLNRTKSSLAQAEREHWTYDIGITDAHQFARLLRLERKRTERSRKPFLLMLLEGTEIYQGAAGRAVLGRVVEALDATVRETDTIGWHELGSVVGVLCTEIGEVEPSTAAAIVTEKVLSSLRETLGPELLKHIRLDVHLFPESTETNKPSVSGGDNKTENRFYREIVQPHKNRPMAAFFKRALDIVGSLGAILALSPVFVVLAALVKLTSKGPVFFRQKRIGQFGQSFTFLKFRSMYTNCDAGIHKEYVTKLIQGKGERQPAGDGMAYKLTNDPRVTPLGRLLRRTSLDELPQFLNVLTGEMSLVGPRPPVPYEFECYDLWHQRRVMEVKPGITGLWQVEGRSRTNFDEMVRLDLRYASSWSIWWDLKILWQTPKAVVSGNGAY